MNKILSISYDQKSERKILTLLGLKIKIGKNRGIFYPIIKTAKKTKLAINIYTSILNTLPRKQTYMMIKSCASTEYK